MFLSFKNIKDFSVGEMEVPRRKWTDAVTQTFCLKCVQEAINLLVAVIFLFISFFCNKSILKVVYTHGRKCEKF